MAVVVFQPADMGDTEEVKPRFIYINDGESIVLLCELTLPVCVVITWSNILCTVEIGYNDTKFGEKNLSL